MGLNGLIVLFDEVESIVTLLPNVRSRLRSYEILYKLTTSREFPRCFFCFAVSPDFGRRLGGWDLKYEYPICKDYYPDACRFMDLWAKDGLTLVRIPKIDDAENMELCSRLTGLHEHAYSWSARDRISLDFIESFVDEAVSRSLLQRDIVRSFVNVLDVCQQHPSFNPAQEMSLSVGRGLVASLRGRGLEVIDRRDQGGALWVVGGQDLKQILRQFEELGASFRFAPSGGQATRQRPAWWIRDTA